MAPITTFILASSRPGAKIEDSFAAIETFKEVIKSTPGSGTLRVARTHEDDTQYRVFIDWDSVEAHQAFRNTDAFKKFASELNQTAAGSSSAFHVEISPFPPAVLDNAEGKGKTAVAEIVFTYYAPDADPAKNLAAVQTLASKLSASAGATGESAVGWSVEKDIDYKGEPSRVLVGVVGWETVAAHEAARNSDAFKAALAEFQGATDAKGIDISHVTTKTL